jgi:2-oxo-4-hydroxy-4-carboxy-5-ureidoimidazoline decarboxylase
MYSIYDVNKMSLEEFRTVFGTVFEHTPEIASKAWCDKPFEDFAALYRAMVQAVESLSQQSKLALICAHPDLGSKRSFPPMSIRLSKI